MKIRLLFALLLMGFTSLVVQTLLIREFLISFYGNELIIGLILANWIILEAAGSISSSRASLKSQRPLLIYALLQLWIALYLPLSIFFIRTAKNMLGLSLGEGVGIFTVITSSFFILAPLSMFDGAQFPFGCRIFSDFSRKPLESTGRVYILEAIGFIFAGPIFTYLLITKLNSFQIALLLGTVNVLSGILLLKDELKDNLRQIFTVIMYLGLGLIIFVFLGFSSKIHYLSINKQWRDQKVLDYRNSIYGNLVVTKTHEQYTFYSDGIPIITTPTPDIASIEEFIHFVCLSHKNPQELLILSGGAGGIIKEALKYPLTRLDYAELDPVIIQLTKKFSSELTQEELSDPRLNIKYLDGRRFARLTKYKYDIILINLPMPSTLQLNRFFTQEFYKNIKSILKEDGIFAFRLPGSLSYISSELRNLNGSILNTLQAEFAFVKIIPGDSNIFLAAKSDFVISPQIFFNRIKEKNIKTYLLTPTLLSYRLDPSWSDWFRESLGNTSKIRGNFDLLPSGVFYSISYWNALFSQKLQGFFRSLERLNFKILLFVICLVGLCLFFFQRTIPKLRKMSIGFAISTTGFVGMSTNLMIIFAYQSFYGFVFHHLALLVTSFMAGLSFGGWLITKNLFRIKKEVLFFCYLELTFAIFCLSLSPLLIYLGKSPNDNLSFILFILSALSGVLVGLEFPLANKIYVKNKTGLTQTAGILYALDLTGAWFATITASVILVPVIGIIKTCILLVVLKLISLVLIRNSLN